MEVLSSSSDWPVSGVLSALLWAGTMAEGREWGRWWRGRNEGAKEKERCERVCVSVCAHASSWCLMTLERTLLTRPVLLPFLMKWSKIYSGLCSIAPGGIRDSSGSVVFGDGAAVALWAQHPSPLERLSLLNLKIRELNNWLLRAPSALEFFHFVLWNPGSSLILRGILCWWASSQL